MASPAWHYVLKFIITGDAAVGKSSLLVRLTDQRFLANPDPTLGVEFGSKLITLPGPEATVVKLQCWDTAGTESFRSITRSYYRGAAGCLLVYDVTSRRSFDNVRTWFADVRAHADAHVRCILVGNKVDLCEGEGEPCSRISLFFRSQLVCCGGGGRGREACGPAPEGPAPQRGRGERVPRCLERARPGAVVGVGGRWTRVVTCLAYMRRWRSGQYGCFVRWFGGDIEIGTLMAVLKWCLYARLSRFRRPACSGTRSIC
ncbi:P-loop containing nucleoside triphosphate hydrolase protein [Mycena capillaripes]|nr:P-loop containing nucleoside triphosphate hydrolase protein [Mycena capillaripes]